MARLHHLLLLLVLAFLLSASAASAAPADVEFIRSSCRSTRYPALCLQCLAGYATAIRRSPRQLACTALNVTLSRAQSASAFVGRAAAGAGSGSRASSRSRGSGAVRDCIQTVGDSVDQLRRSLKELARIPRRGSPEFAWHLSNAQTWVSAALTDDTTCLDGIADAKVDPHLRAAIRGRILELAQVTSNALALINRMAGPH
ncbi:hypothetical protein Taro_052720 [Colocasia esculenta]|uniref:Pectinesterase inhibitor domain-containing protein n=1 Tax=Colocasia esculenta TaxID=4460 RepID=A0A843XJ48_COLES|nr:hypothetical protein [Colocasia esculenta]